MKKLLLFAISILSLHTAVLAQFPISGTVWDGFTGTSPTGPSTFPNVPATVIPGVAAMNVSQWNRQGLNWNTATDTYNSTDFPVGGTFAAAVASGKYLYFTITNNTTTEAEITQISLNTRVSSTGPTTVQMVYAIGSGADAAFGSSSATSPTSGSGSEVINFTAVAHICPGQTATFKLYGWGGSTAAGTLRVNNGTSITAMYAVGPPTVTVFNSSDVTFPACSGDWVDFTSITASGVAPYTYAWSGPGSYTSTESDPTIDPVTAANAGTYSLTVTDAYGCISSPVATTEVYVSPGPDTTMTVTGPLSFCTPNSATLTVPFDPFYIYTWYDVTTGLPVDFDESYTAFTSGSYLVEITDWGITGCTALSDTYTVAATVTPTATITASGPLTMCTPNTVTLSTPTGTGYTYQWYNGSGTIAGATNASYNVTASGTYSVTIVNGSCSATSAGVTVTINTSPVTPVVTPAGPVTICSGTPLTLTSTTQTGVTYRWWRGATAIPGATNSTYSPALSGTYSMVVTNTGNTCNATSNGVVVTINPTPVTTITTNPGTTVCSGNSVTLSTTASAGNTYQWLLNGNPIAGATNATYNTSTAGVYRVVVTTTATGCFDTTTAPGTTITAAASPTAAQASISPAGPFTICSNDSVVLSVPSTAGYTYQWFRPVLIAGATNNTYTARVTGNYSVRVTNAAGCSTTSGSTVSITVNAAPAPGVTLSGSATFCAGSSVTISAATGVGYTYQWYDASGPIAGETASDYNATTSGVYHAVITAPNACQTTTASTTVTVVPMPFIIYSGSPSFCAGNTILLTVSTAGVPGVIYQWRRNGVVIPGAVSATYAANVSGDYTVFVNIPGSCSVITGAVTITVFPTLFPTITFDGTYVKTFSSYATYQWYINTITIPGATSYRYAAYTNASYRVMVTDTNGCQLLSAEYPIYNLAVENANGSQQDVNIYPNPATNTVNVSAPGMVQVSISTMEGKLVITGTNQKDIDVSALANGLYMVIVNDKDGNRLHTEKLVVNR